MTNPFENLTTEVAIKKAYRKLSLTCHPDVRPDKDVAAEEFRELTKIYEMALKNLRKPKPKPSQTNDDWWHRPPPQPRPKPTEPIIEEINLGDIDNFEFQTWGEAVRTIICSRDILEWGGELRIIIKVPKVKILGMQMGEKTETWKTKLPPNCPNPMKVRLQLPIGPVVLTLVGRR